MFVFVLGQNTHHCAVCISFKLILKQCFVKQTEPRYEINKLLSNCGICSLISYIETFPLKWRRLIICMMITLLITRCDKNVISSSADVLLNLFDTRRKCRAITAIPQAPACRRVRNPPGGGGGG